MLLEEQCTSLVLADVFDAAVVRLSSYDQHNNGFQAVQFQPIPSAISQLQEQAVARTGSYNSVPFLFQFRVQP